MNINKVIILRKRRRRHFRCPACHWDFWISGSEADMKAGRCVEEAEWCPFCGGSIEAPGIARDEAHYGCD